MVYNLTMTADVCPVLGVQQQGSGKEESWDAVQRGAGVTWGISSKLKDGSSGVEWGEAKWAGRERSRRRQSQE